MRSWNVVAGAVGAMLWVGGCPGPETAPDAPSTPDAIVELDAARQPDGGSDAGLDAASVPDAHVALDARVSPDAARLRGDAAIDAGPTPASVVFVLQSIDVPNAPTGPMMNIAPGLDLDGRVSDGTGTATCEDYAVDFVSPSGTTGVDNQLVGNLIPLIDAVASGFDVQAQIAAQVADGTLLVAVRVHDLDDALDDASVLVDVFLVKPADCAADVCPPAGGVVSAAEHWLDRGMPIATSAPGSLAGGRLRAQISSFAVTVDVPGGVPFPIVLRDAVLEADFSLFGLDDVSIAGGLTIDELVAYFESVMPGIGETARGILEDSADLKPGAGTPMVCERISGGMGAVGVPGTID
ncbi:MAG: hypothetical protein K1X94_28985 [Sandaracinaceae bacterium]|nr:hypothetical protein [Sandaracinaceae bacterium]